MQYIAFFTHIARDDVAQFGGKNAAIGEMIQHLSDQGVRVPHGFATTADAYWRHLELNDIKDAIAQELQTVSRDNLDSLRKAGKAVRNMIIEADMPDDIAQEIRQAYRELSQMYEQELCDVAVRSSATAEDLPHASFAGQQDTFLNVSGEDALIDYCKRSMASLFTDRAIIYRLEKGFKHMQVALSVGVQKMVRSDKASAGVTFTLDTETGFRDVIATTSSYGLGETVVKGEVNPDEFLVHQTKVQEGYTPIIQKRLGDKRKKLVYTEKDGATSTELVDVPHEQRHQFSLTDAEICELSRYSATIEDYYSRIHGTWYPMDIEWAKDGIDGKLYIVQARPETVHSQEQQKKKLVEYTLDQPREQQDTIASGQRIGRGIASGTARSVTSMDELDEFHEGDILVTQMTGPDWVPIMKKASAIITDLGGRTCHAAIVSRELGIPAVIGTNSATQQIDNGDMITVDCSHGNTGYVYAGEVPYTQEEHTLEDIPQLPCDLYINLADPSSAFNASFYPVDGIGLARLEFIVANIIRVHPQAARNPDAVDDETREAIVEQSRGYASPRDYFVDVLAQSIGHMAAAMYPRPVIVRTTDFKTHEYRELIGGATFEPEDEPNPMLGFRGVSRYYHERYRDAFALECEALHKVRYTMGFDNMRVMLPFVRTVQEAKQAQDIFKAHDLLGDDGIPLYMMVEIPSNVILLEHFVPYFDGLSIGSNDLTQLVLGVDRDSAVVRHIFDERDPAVKTSMQRAIEQAKAANTPIGICGQAPSDYPEIADFLIEHGIDSMSLNLDSIMPFLTRWKAR